MKEIELELEGADWHEVGSFRAFLCDEELRWYFDIPKDAQFITVQAIRAKNATARWLKEGYHVKEHRHHRVTICVQDSCGDWDSHVAYDAFIEWLNGQSHYVRVLV